MNSPKKRKDVLRKFFVVTLTSLYQVSMFGRNRQICVEKIAIKEGLKSKVRVGSKLSGGDLVGLRSKGLLLYSEDYEYYCSHPRIQRPESVNTRSWGGYTSSIIALFTKEKEARSCFEVLNGKECDQRWLRESNKTIGRIGDDHPKFILSRDPGWVFPPEYYSEVKFNSE